ncbi:hypothetical protein CDAR_121021 [Caerostris darwini]|uniref:Uncharacterized protein n=1 Tax=Caerostris darwini TaxID=1538125 RepID=A0AAV4PQZ0_9ARAC|nr:hypothetical protein CDAR_121021 [Caerostris darwini]
MKYTLWSTDLLGLFLYRFMIPIDAFPYRDMGTYGLRPQRSSRHVTQNQLLQTTLRHSSLLTPSLYNSLKLYDELKTRFFFLDHYACRKFFPPRKIYCNDSIVTAFGAPHLCCRKFTPFPPLFIGGSNRSQPSLNSDLRGHKQ